MSAKRNIFIFAVVCFIMNIAIAYVQARDERKTNIPQTSHAVDPLTVQANIPNTTTTPIIIQSSTLPRTTTLPDLRQPTTVLPNIPKSPVVQLSQRPQTPTFPRLPQMPIMPQVSTMSMTVGGEYIGVKTDTAGKKRVFIKDSQGNKKNFLLATDYKVFKGNIAIPLDELKQGELIAVQFEPALSKEEGNEDTLKFVFVVRQETSLPKDETAKEEPVVPEGPVLEEGKITATEIQQDEQTKQEKELTESGSKGNEKQ
ncbi:MAG: hypothetical protein V1893_03525 [Candidatus Omnitrophota bacterium]